MVRIFLIVLAVLVLAGGGGFVYLGMFPPEAKVQQVEKPLPADKFRSR